MNKNKITNIIIWVIAAAVLYMRAPTIIENFKNQDQKAADFHLKTLNGEDFNLSTQPKKMVIVFWATWCGPCELELKRINKMIDDKKIRASNVLAISSREDESTLREKVVKKNYLFNVGVDSNGEVASLYNVSATPTILLIDDKQIINWMTTGLSPSLEYRISTFFSE